LHQLHQGRIIDEGNPLSRVVARAVLSALLPAATVGPIRRRLKPTGAVLPPDTLPGPYNGKPYDQPELWRTSA